MYNAIKGGDHMDFGTIASLISSVGFPIAACVYLVYNQNKADERHRDEIDKLRQSLDNNTKVITKLCSKLKVNIDEEDE